MRQRDPCAWPETKSARSAAHIDYLGRALCQGKREVLRDLGSGPLSFVAVRAEGWIDRIQTTVTIHGTFDEAQQRRLE